LATKQQFIIGLYIFLQRRQLAKTLVRTNTLCTRMRTVFMLQIIL